MATLASVAGFSGFPVMHFATAILVLYNIPNIRCQTGKVVTQPAQMAMQEVPHYELQPTILGGFMFLLQVGW